MRSEWPTYVQHPVPHYGSKPSTSPCRSPPRLPRRAAGRGCALRGPRVCRIRRLAMAASRARPHAARATRPPPPIEAGGGICAGPGRPKCVPHPARRDRSEPSTSQRLSRDATTPFCHCRRRGVRRAAQVCAASGASRTPRAEHVPVTVPLVRRDSPLLPWPAGGLCAGRPTCVPNPTGCYCS
jgi:hypothetical protein